jgi:hypothetical protein
MGDETSWIRTSDVQIIEVTIIYATLFMGVQAIMVFHSLPLCRAELWFQFKHG